MKLGWTTVTLGEVADIERRGVDPASLAADTAYLGLEHIESGGRIIGRSTVGDSAVASTKFRFGPEHVLFGKLRPYLAKIAAPDFNGVCSTDILPIRPKPLLHARYLEHFLRQPVVVDLASARATGANLPRLSPAELARFELPLPPIEEQRRIAGILDQARGVRDLFSARESRLGTFEEAAFRSAFSGTRATTTVGDVAEAMRTGPFGSQLLHDEFVESGVAVVGLDNVVANEFRWVGRRFITPEKFEQLKRYELHPHDVLISIMGTIGRCVVVPDDIPVAINTKHVCAITPGSNLLSRYLRGAFLWHPDARSHLRKQTKGSIMDGLNMGIIKSMPLALPPMDRQKEFAARMAVVDAVRDRVGSQALEAGDLLGSLQARAFSGRL